MSLLRYNMSLTNDCTETIYNERTIFESYHLTMGHALLLYELNHMIKEIYFYI
jgi:hypothetical protein